MKRQDEKAARDREVLLEMQKLVPHAEMCVKHKCGQKQNIASAIAPRRVKIPSAIAIPAKSCRTIVATNATLGTPSLDVAEAALSKFNIRKTPS